MPVTPLPRSRAPRILALTVLAALAACRQQPAEPANQAEPEPANNMAAAAPPPAPPPPPEAAPLDREQLLLAVSRAASAFGGNYDDGAAQAELDNRRFELRMRFGCGAVPEGVEGINPRAVLGGAGRRLNLAATPDISLDDPIAKGAAGEDAEAAEGFWIAAPWLLRPACPPARGFSTQASAVGIAQFFTGEDSRLQRRNERDYSTVVELPEGQSPPETGYDLVITGRLRAGPQGKVIHCGFRNPASEPACVLRAEFERVRIDNAETGAQVAEWGRG